jgi:uracil-DNA glycosylase
MSVQSPGSSLASRLPEDWQTELTGELRRPYFGELEAFLAEERRQFAVYPPEQDVFNAFRHCPYDRTRVLILGQDPYHDAGQAHGLCFSVRSGTLPPSLVNILRELHDDVGCPIPNNGFLMPWADQGVLLLNAVLTVRAHAPNSHKNRGWETFTDAVIRKVSEKRSPVVFVLWGTYARKKRALIDSARHAVVLSAHPSPLSARSGFFGSRPFSKINAALRSWGAREIDWRLPDL